VVRAAFAEQQAFRIDHYLGKPAVQNLMALRFGNALFEPLWRRESIANIQITLAESIGVGTRGDFYDRTGALRDMVQNHALQLLTMVAMEPPSRNDADAIRDEKLKVLRSLRPFTEESVARDVVRGQYRAGTVGGVAVPGYLDEVKVPADSHCETFVAMRTEVQNWRWAGVPFYLRTGKRLPKRVTEIVIQFRCVPHSIFAGKGATMQPNRLVIGIQPEENITLSLMAKVPGLDREGIRLRSVPLNIAMPDAFTGAVRRIAYERLLLDLVEGDQTLFVRRDEVEAQWEWVDAIRAGWEAEGLTPKTYTAGSWGPSAAIALAERDGVTWHE
jgi:glucose-6-phosphate 1-dehydrogenase